MAHMYNKGDNILSRFGLGLVHFSIYHLLGKLLELSLTLKNISHIIGITESRLSKNISNENISIYGFRDFRKKTP